MPGPLNFESDVFDAVERLAPRRLVWRVERQAVGMDVPKYEMARHRDVREAVTHLQYVTHRVADRCARTIAATFFVGKREETRTDQVRYAGTATYRHVRSWEERETLWPVWAQVVFLLTCPWLWWPRERIAYRLEVLEGRVGYGGSVPYTYVHTTMIDPFIEDHYAPLMRHGNPPTHIEAAEPLDYANATWRVE